MFVEGGGRGVLVWWRLWSVVVLALLSLYFILVYFLFVKLLKYGLTLRSMEARGEWGLSGSQSTSLEVKSSCVRVVCVRSLYFSQSLARNCIYQRANSGARVVNEAHTPLNIQYVRRCALPGHVCAYCACSCSCWTTSRASR